MTHLIRHRLVLASLSFGWLAVSTAHAHFVWLATDSEGRAIYFFGESVADQTYRLPEKLASAAVSRHGADGQRSTPLGLSPVDSDSFIGRRSQDPIPTPGSLTSQQTYGLYQGSRLTYHAQHISGPPGKWNSKPLDQVDFQAVLRMEEDTLVAQLLFRGQPLAGAKVQLFEPDGSEHAAATTDDRGHAEFNLKQLQPGLVGLLVGHVDKNAQGKLNGETYTSDAHYLSVTIRR
jgi:hypothetical protein